MTRTTIRRRKRFYSVSPPLPSAPRPNVAKVLLEKQKSTEKQHKINKFFGEKVNSQREPFFYTEDMDWDMIQTRPRSYHLKTFKNKKTKKKVKSIRKSKKSAKKRK